MIREILKRKSNPGVTLYGFPHYRCPFIYLCVLFQRQTQPLEIDCVFNLDDLPVSFPSNLPTKEDEKFDRFPLNHAIKQIVELIWERGGFRFRHQSTHWNSDPPLFGYVCSQDVDRAQASISKGERDAWRMERYSCREQAYVKAVCQ